MASNTYKNMYKGNAIDFAAGYNETGNMPIDIRLVVDKKERLIDKAWWSATGEEGGDANYYAGMPVFVQETGEVYVLKADITPTHKDGEPYPAVPPWVTIRSALNPSAEIVLGPDDPGAYDHWTRIDASAYKLPIASDIQLGGILTGYNGGKADYAKREFPVKVDSSGKAYVVVDAPIWEGEPVASTSESGTDTSGGGSLEELGGKVE